MKEYILIIDDQITNLRTLHDSLDSNYNVLVAQDSYDGINIAVNEKPSLILLDAMMPEIDGFEICKQIKAHPLTYRIPVIFLTALHDQASRTEGLRSGAVDFVTKPFCQEELLMRINNQITLYNRTYLDPITGLLQDSFFLEEIEQLGTDYHIICLDIHRFRYINSFFGRESGDFVLAQIAFRLKDFFSRQTLICRFEGDRFAIAIFDKTLEEAKQLALATLQLFETSFTLGQEQVSLSVSIGISSGVKDNPSKAIQQGAVALRQARDCGENISLFAAECEQTLIREQYLEMALRKVIEDEAIHLYYQPIFDLASMSLAGFEGLMRWQHQGRWIPPSVFIPVAEITGLIHNLGRFAITRACQQLQIMPPDLFISVNLSFLQLKRKDFVPFLREALKKYSITPGRLKLEITETSTFDLPVEVFEEIVEIGVPLCIDDFGTGYSSLTRLSRLPLSYLKIDKTFLKEERYEVIVEAINTLASGFGMAAIAEGVESEQHLQLLQEIGTRYGQGFYFGKAISAKEVTTRFF